MEKFEETLRECGRSFGIETEEGLAAFVKGRDAGLPITRLADKPTVTAGDPLLKELRREVDETTDRLNRLLAERKLREARTTAPAAQPITDEAFDTEMRQLAGNLGIESKEARETFATGRA